MTEGTPAMTEPAGVSSHHHSQILERARAEGQKIGLSLLALDHLLPVGGPATSAALDIGGFRVEPFHDGGLAIAIAAASEFTPDTLTLTAGVLLGMADAARLTGLMNIPEKPTE